MWRWALGLFLLAPVCAEYLWAYDSSTGKPLELLAGLAVLAPLYGAPALLVRETARRLGLGWPGILLLAAAFGVVEAGMVDQSMFAREYRDIPYWDAMAGPTWVEPLGVGGYLALTFVVGHVVQSIGAPIALMESLAGRDRSRPWLRVRGIVVAAVLWVAASALVLADHVGSGNAHASLPQLTACAGLAVALVGLAVGQRRRVCAVEVGTAPAPLWLGLAAYAATLVVTLVPATVAGTLAAAGVVLVAAIGVGETARRGDWGQHHVLALAVGALAAAGSVAYLAPPLFDVSPVAKYAHSSVLLVAGLGLVLLARRRLAS